MNRRTKSSDNNPTMGEDESNSSNSLSLNIGKSVARVDRW